MKNFLSTFRFSALILLTLMISNCDDNWLERDSKTIVTEEEVWNDRNQILALLANYYDRLPMFSGFHTSDSNNDWQLMAFFDDAMWSGNIGNDAINKMSFYANDLGTYWDYGLIRDINLALENIEKYCRFEVSVKNSYSAELRFLRAFVYFELVKRMGGVPLITTQLIYDFSGDPSSVQYPRAKEAEIYDFISQEIDEIADILGNEKSYTRANKYTALALKSRAMLYAGSIARYNNLMPIPIETEGGEIGIPATMADEYYRKSLDASLKIITDGKYALYEKNTANRGENFYEMLMTKSNNPEIIFAKDFSVVNDKRHWFTHFNIARDVREDNIRSSAMTPSLNLVESFDYLNGSAGTLKNKTPDGSDYIYYDNVSDLFAGKDARLYGTVIYPGTKFRGLNVELQAGVKLWNESTQSYSNVEGSSLGSTYTDGGVLTGAGGPHRSMQEVSNTGFYFRKYISSSVGASTRTTLSENFWVWFRLGEIYLNATEAAFELGLPEAKNYLNRLRERAGFPENSIDMLTINIIRNERRVELAFEDHRYFDLKRWRMAHEIWDGNSNNPATMIYALYPYRIVRPGDALDGKYVFDKLVAPRFQSAHYFSLANYYSEIPQSVINNNPKIIPNPFH